MATKFVENVEVDGVSIIVNPTHKIEAKISAASGNILQKKDDGLFVPPMGGGGSTVISPTKTGVTFDRTLLDNQYLMFAEFITADGVKFVAIDKEATDEKERIETLPYQAAAVRYSNYEYNQSYEFGFYMDGDPEEVVGGVDLVDLFDKRIIEKLPAEGKILQEERVIKLRPRFVGRPEWAEFEQVYTLRLGNGGVVERPDTPFRLKRKDFKGSYNIELVFDLEVVEKPDGLRVEAETIRYTIRTSEASPVIE